MGWHITNNLVMRRDSTPFSKFRLQIVLVARVGSQAGFATVLAARVGAQAALPWY